MRRLTVYGGLMLFAMAVAGCSDSSGGGQPPASSRPDTLDPVPPDIGLPGGEDADVFEPDAADVFPLPDADWPEQGPMPDIGFFDAGPREMGVGDTGPLPAADVNIAFVGPCAPDFGGDLEVQWAPSIQTMSISSVQGPQLLATLQLSLGSAMGQQFISTSNQLETGLSLVLLTAQTWRNVSLDPDVISGQAPDPISGQLFIDVYQPGAGISELRFVGVVLKDVGSDSLCQLDGTLITRRLGQ